MCSPRDASLHTRTFSYCSNVSPVRAHSPFTQLCSTLLGAIAAIASVCSSSPRFCLTAQIHLPLRTHNVPVLNFSQQMQVAWCNGSISSFEREPLHAPACFLSLPGDLNVRFLGQACVCSTSRRKTLVRFQMPLFVLFDLSFPHGVVRGVNTYHTFTPFNAINIPSS